jgi:hypothetical protein
MAHMLGVTAFEVGHPVLEFVLMKANDFALHAETLNLPGASIAIEP